MNDLKKIVSLCKRRGFIFSGSEIYGGLANTWDYGQYGINLKNNVKKIWWKNFIQSREDMLGLDASIFMNKKVWEASGHVNNFFDPLVDCKKCKGRFRADKIVEEKYPDEKVEGKSNKDILDILINKKIKCPKCGSDASNFTEPRSFNMMFETSQGVVKESENKIYLRPETAQGIFVNFKNVLNSSRKKLPFGIGQIGKAFRNEITPGNFTFRTREFEQMEIEYFCKKENWKKLYDTWRENMEEFYKNILNLSSDNFRWRQHTEDELSHYSKETWDVEFKFPFGWGELWGIAYRTDYDLMQHQNCSKSDMKYFDSETNEKYLPHVIEPTFGCDRTILAILCDAYCEEKLENGEQRTVLKFAKDLSPVDFAILPLSKKLSKIAKDIYDKMKFDFVCEYDETGSIGKRYRRQDEIGTPSCITIDFETEKDDSVTVRDRDTMKQKRIKIKDLGKF